MTLSVNQKNNRRIRNIITLIIVILNSGFALTVGNSGMMILVNIIYLIYLIIFNKSIVVSKRQKNFLTLVMIFMGGTILVNLDLAAMNEYFRLIIMILLSFCIVGSYSCGGLLKGFCILMRVMSVCSCLLYIIVAHIPAINFPKITNALGTSYYTCIVGNIEAESRNIDFIRNSGVFWEGGMYAAIIALWLIIEINCNYKKKKTFLVLLLGVFTIYTTKSTTGYLYMALLIFAFICHTTNERRKLWQTAILIVGITMAVVLYFNYEELLLYLVDKNELVFNKLVLKNASYTDRFNGPVADLLVGFSNPLGVGTGHVTEIVNNMAVKVFNTELTSRTSTLTYFFAAFGVPMGVLVSWQGLKFFKNNILSKIDMMIAMGLFIIVTLSTPLNNNMLFWIFLFISSGTVSSSFRGENEWIER